MLQSPLLLMVHSGISVRTFPEWLAWMRSDATPFCVPGLKTVGSVAANDEGFV